MNQDREMILKMLKDGKVTVEEAEALLQVLEESEEETSPSQGRDPEKAHGEDRKRGDEQEAHRGPKGFRFRFDEDFDLSFIGDTVRKSLSGLKDTIREAMDGIGEVDFEAEIKRAFGKEKARAETDLILSAEGISEFTLRAASGETGDVAVTASPDDMIHVHGVVSGWGDDVESAMDRARAVVLRSQIEGTTAVVAADTGDGEGIRRVRIDYSIQLPPTIAVNLDTVGGDISIADVTGPCRLSTISGDIELRSIGDAVRARSKSGDITAEAIAGRVDLAGLSGDLEVQSAEGGVVCDSKSGDIRVSGAKGGVEAKSMSGDVEVMAAAPASGSAPGGPIKLSAVSGDVELVLPPESSCAVRLSTTSGSINCALPLADRQSSRSSVSGTLGAAETEVAVSTVSGDVELR